MSDLVTNEGTIKSCNYIAKKVRLHSRETYKTKQNLKSIHQFKTSSRLRDLMLKISQDFNRI